MAYSRGAIWSRGASFLSIPHSLAVGLYQKARRSDRRGGRLTEAEHANYRPNFGTKSMKALLTFCLLPLVAHSSLLAGTQAGQKLWEFESGGGLSSPAIGLNGTIYAGSTDGNVYALN